MFNTDKPINTMSEDKFGRSSFAKQLANGLTNCVANIKSIVEILSHDL